MTEVVPRTVEELVRESGVGLLRFAYVLCGDRYRAEDLLQDVFLTMHARFPNGITVEQPVSYARRALINANISRARRRSSTELTIDELPETPTSAETDRLPERVEMWDALRGLPPRHRTVLVLRYYLDWSDDDIADAIGARRATVRSLAARALASLREHDFTGGVS